MVNGGFRDMGFGRIPNGGFETRGGAILGFLRPFANIFRSFVASKWEAYYLEPRMKKLLSILSLAILLIACRGSDHPETPGKTDSSQSKVQLSKPSLAVTMKPRPNSIPDFLELGKSAKETDRGYLQGVDKSDSAGPFVRKE